MSFTTLVIYSAQIDQDENVRETYAFISAPNTLSSSVSLNKPLSLPKPASSSGDRTQNFNEITHMKGTSSVLWKCAKDQKSHAPCPVSYMAEMTEESQCM